MILKDNNDQLLTILIIQKLYIIIINISLLHIMMMRSHFES